MKARKFETVVLQFKFNQFNSVPPYTRQMMRKAAEKTDRSLAGEKVIEPTKGVLATQFLLDLEKAGYSLIAATCEERKTAGKPSYAVRFVFAPIGSKNTPSVRFLLVKSTVKRELFEICNSALWEVTHHINPCTTPGGAVSKVRKWASIVFSTRQPFYQGDGQPVVIWQKDAVGERIGDVPLPIEPSHTLRMLENGFQLQTW